MSFDWDKFEDEPENGEFNWDAHEDVTPEGDKASKIETGIMHGLQGATGGFLDELSGAGEAVGRVVGIEGLGGKFSDVGLAKDGPTLKMDILKEAYQRARDRKRGILAEQSKDNPAIAGTANLAGAVVSPINKLTKGMSLARSGAAIGGLNALGNSEADLTKGDLAGAGIDTAIGAGTGLLVGKGIDKAAPYIGSAAKKVGENSRKAAEWMASRALGAERGTIKSLGADKVRQAGAQALDEGVLSPFASTDDLIARNAAVKDLGGKLMGEAYQAIDDAGASTFNPLEVAGKVDDQLGGFYRSPINRGETNQLENTLESILMRGEGNIPLRDAQILKQELGSVANWKNNLNITDKEKMAREAYRIVSQQIDDAVTNGAGAIDRAGLTETLKQGKNLYSGASTSEKLLQNKHAREQGNKLFGLTDTITGVGAGGYGASTGDWEGAAGAMAAKKYLGKYGAQQSALVLDKVAKSLMRSPKLADLAQRNPKAFNAIVANVAERTRSKASGPLSNVAGFDPTQPVSEDKAKSAFVEGN